jgi:hypothetical protein
MSGLITNALSELSKRVDKLEELEAKRSSELAALSGSAMKDLCAAIVEEAINKGWADMWNEAYNWQAHVEITLTLKEIRTAAAVIGYRGKKNGND